MVSAKRKSQKRKEREEKERRSKRAKSRKVAKHFVFAMFCSPEGQKSRLAKAAGVEASGRMRDEKLHAAVPRSTKMHKTPQVQSVFGS